MINEDEGAIGGQDNDQRPHSERTPKLTEKMREIQAQETQKRETQFNKAYDRFKRELVSVTDTVNSECTENTLYSLIDGVPTKYETVLKAYDTIRYDTVDLRALKS